jgi:uncharacterized coiled-coil protein SlyX
MECLNGKNWKLHDRRIVLSAEISSGSRCRRGSRIASACHNSGDHIGLGGALFWYFGSSTVFALPSDARVTAAPAREQVSNEILETAKGLGITQQQAVDQLQVVQDQLAMQKAETKRLSEQIAAVTEKLDALQQSIASIPAPTVAALPPAPKSRHQ